MYGPKITEAISLLLYGDSFGPAATYPLNSSTIFNLGAVPDNAGMCYWIGDEEESIKQGEAG